MGLIVLQVFTMVGFILVWTRLQRPPADDPRLTKGLQLLQSKIAVLEDLSDRTETQVNQLTALLENKVRDIQIKIMDADRIKSQIEQSIQKSLEVAKIFQDKIPHQEILDRQYTIKYVRAAKLAHQGVGIEEISREVDLTPAEIELIVKLNKEQLMFSDSELPGWVNDPPSEPTKNSKISSPWVDFEKAFEVPKVDHENLKKLGEEFKKAIADSTKTSVQKLNTANVSDLKITDVKISEGKVEDSINQNGKKVKVKPYEFKRIESVNDFI
jgi:Protein of unknown function (DUF2802)